MRPTLTQYFRAPYLARQEFRMTKRNDAETAPARTLIFLNCGCAAYKVLAHPTGEAFLVEVWQQCETHGAQRERLWVVRKRESLRQFCRTELETLAT